MVPVALEDLAPSGQAALARLFQLYVYDWSERLPLDVGEDGRFADQALQPYLTGQPPHRAFLFRAAGQLAGFTLVTQRSRLTGDPGVCDVAEFFVMRRHRRQGVGRAAAVATFDRFPGSRWEVRQRPDNPTATSFWRAVIDRYSGGRYTEASWNDAAWVGPVQAFQSPPITSRSP